MPEHTLLYINKEKARDRMEVSRRLQLPATDHILADYGDEVLNPRTLVKYKENKD